MKWITGWFHLQSFSFKGWSKTKGSGEISPGPGPGSHIESLFAATGLAAPLSPGQYPPCLCTWRCWSWEGIADTLGLSPRAIAWAGLCLRTFKNAVMNLCHSETFPSFVSMFQDNYTWGQKFLGWIIPTGKPKKELSWMRKSLQSTARHSDKGWLQCGLRYLAGCSLQCELITPY